jgi:hypothetical protein
MDHCNTPQGQCPQVCQLTAIAPLRIHLCCCVTLSVEHLLVATALGSTGNRQAVPMRSALGQSNWMLHPGCTASSWEASMCHNLCTSIIWAQLLQSNLFNEKRVQAASCQCCEHKRDDHHAFGEAKCAKAIMQERPGPPDPWLTVA